MAAGDVVLGEVEHGATAWFAGVVEDELGKAKAAWM
jgi:hypothetical protein